MTNYEIKRMLELYGPDYLETDIPTYIRERDEGFDKIREPNSIKHLLSKGCAGSCVSRAK